MAHFVMLVSTANQLKCLFTLTLKGTEKLGKIYPHWSEIEIILILEVRTLKP